MHGSLFAVCNLIFVCADFKPEPAIIKYNMPVLLVLVINIASPVIINNLSIINPGVMIFVNFNNLHDLLRT
jgi:hypothetical protein